MNELALTRAVEDGSLSTVETLLAADCADVNIVSTDGGASTALHVAASYGQDAIASVLLQKGAATDRLDHFGYTPLMRAAVLGHLAVVKILLTAGADKMALDLRTHRS